LQALTARLAQGKLFWSDTELSQSWKPEPILSTGSPMCRQALRGLARGCAQRSTTLPRHHAAATALTAAPTPKGMGQ